MLCAHCGGETATAALRCGVCGEEPTLAGRYRLLALLGSGGQATTYRAERISDGGAVAIKELLLRRLQDWKALELFEREAAVLRAIDVDGVPRYLDQLTVGSGKQQGFYLVQELVEGRSLEEERRTLRRDEPAIAATLAEVADILARLHELRPPVVHRDVKPSNILRRADGKIMLIDFGAVADALRDAALGGSTVAGTFGYMAPEQFAGRCEPASDLYGLGATAVALLSGRPAQELVQAGNALAWRGAVVASPAMAALLNDLLAAEPAARPADAHAVAVRLRKIAAGDVAAPAWAGGMNPVASALQGVSLSDIVKGKVDVGALIESISKAASGREPNGPMPELVVELAPAPRPISTLAVRKIDPHVSFNLLFGAIFGGVAATIGTVLTTMAVFGDGPTEMGFIGAGVLLLFGGIGAGVFGAGVRRWARLRRLARHGERTTGRLLEVVVDRSLRVNGRSPLAVRYTYLAQGTTYEGEVHSWLRSLRGARPGQPLTVLFDPSQPADSIAWLPGS